MNILNNYLHTPVVQTSFSVPPRVPSNTQYHNPNSSLKTSIFTINDVHGQIPKMTRLVTASEEMEVMADRNGSDLLKLCSGDTFIGSDEKRNKVSAKFLDVADLDAHALGNHEFDITAKKCDELLKDSKLKTLAMNLNFPSASAPLADKISRSMVVNGKQGDQYGLIGLQPVDLVKRMKNKEGLAGITVDDKEQTIKELQQEVDKLREQGINKIFLLSHTGNAVEREIAQRVSGIDVILGGHSHHLIKGVTAGENYFYTPEGEPVVITQAGRDGNNFCLLNLEFDEDGKLTYVQNNIYETNSFSPDMVMSKIVDSELGPSPQIGNLSYVDPLPKNVNTEENAWADFVADAIKTRMDADVVLINSANFRGSVGLGKVTERDISSIFPFCNKLNKVRLNEEDLVDAIKFAASKTFNSHNTKPGIIQVGGLTYTVNTKGDLLDLYFIDKQGQKHQIDVNDPDDDKYYTAVYDEFLINGGDDLEMLERDDDEIIEKYDYDKDKVTIDYIKTLNQPFEVRKDNRITIVQ